MTSTPVSASTTDYSIDTSREARAAEQWLAGCLARAKIRGRFSDYFDVTPAMAKLLLTRNATNRVLNEESIRLMASALVRGEWEVNGETIIISDTGELNDGQHRLLAVIRSGMTLTTNMAFGVSRTSRMTVDTGAKRTSGHFLSMAGFTNGNRSAAALKALLNLEAGVSIDAGRTSTEILHARVKYSKIEQSCNTVQKASGRLRVAPSVLSALHYQMARSNQEQADHFFKVLGDGVGRELAFASHPITRLLNRLQDNIASKSKLPPVEVAALVIKAWNRYKTGRDAGVLRWASKGEKSEPFPVVL